MYKAALDIILLIHNSISTHALVHFLSDDTIVIVPLKRVTQVDNEVLKEGVNCLVKWTDGVQYEATVKAIGSAEKMQSIQDKMMLSGSDESDRDEDDAERKATQGKETAIVVVEEDDVATEQALPLLATPGLSCTDASFKATVLEKATCSYSEASIGLYNSRSPVALAPCGLYKIFEVACGINPKQFTGYNKSRRRMMAGESTFPCARNEKDTTIGQASPPILQALGLLLEAINPDPMIFDKWRRQQPTQHGCSSVPTLRHHECHILLDPEFPSVRCPCCSTFRSILHTGIWKEKLNGCTSNSDKVNYRFLTVRELTDTIQRLQHKYRTLQKSAERLKENVLRATEENGVTLDEEWNCRGGNVEIAEATCKPLPKRRCRSQQNTVVYNENQSAIDLGSCNDFILMKALLYVVNEEATRFLFFKSSRPKQIAQGLAEWIHEHPNSASAFEKAVVESFLNCIPFSSSSPYKKKTRTQMWGKYHTLRTSIAYVEDWKAFLHTSQVSYNPIFCQCVGYFIFKDLVKAQLAVHSSKFYVTKHY
ncbi:hypothetical protein EMCRGX_G003222 [Ephydatia muelleri]